jgi:hypothetical protein
MRVKPIRIRVLAISTSWNIDAAVIQRERAENFGQRKWKEGGEEEKKKREITLTTSFSRSIFVQYLV